MKRLLDLFLKDYENERFYNKKKAEYLLRFLPLLIGYLFCNIVIAQLYGNRSVDQLIEGILIFMLYLIVAFLVYMCKVEWSVTLMILIGVIQSAFLVVEPIALQFGVHIFIMLLVTAIIHIEFYQLILSFIAFNGMLIYRVYYVSAYYPYHWNYGDCLYTIFSGVVLSLGAAFLIRTIDREIENEELLEHVSETDALTNLPNRRKFGEIFTSRFSGYEKCVLLLDLDDFKLINDTYGHQAGDQVLIAVAKILQDSIRNSDAVFRWGGEEFVILLRGVTEELGCEIADRIRANIEKHDFGYSKEQTVSIGMLHIGMGATVELLNNYLRRADRALYKAKKEGKNRVVIDHKFQLMVVEIE